MQTNILTIPDTRRIWPHERRSFVKGSFFLVFLWIFWGSGIVAAMESDKAVSNELEKAALQEGKVVWYTTITAEQSLPLAKKFEAKYPGIKVDLHRGSSENTLEKIFTEARGNKYLWDVSDPDGVQAYILKEKQILLKYPYRESQFIPMRDLEGYWIADMIETHVIVYNTKLFSKEEGPKAYSDLLEPRFRGKLGMDSSDIDWFANQLKIMGKDKGLAFMQALAKQNISFRQGHRLLSTLCVTGELPVAVNVYADAVEELKGKGAPIEWVGVEPVLAHPIALNISARAPHPNAAKLFFEFVLSKEGQTILRDLGRIPGRTDIETRPPRLTKGLKFFPSDASLLGKDYNEYSKQFQQIFLKR